MNCQRHNISAEQQSSIPGLDKIVRVLRDGYWDRTDVIQMKDGTLRVRKVSKGPETPGLWGISTLRSEIRYMSSLDEKTAKHFPKVLSAWENGPNIGYETEYITEALAVSDLVQSASLNQEQANIFQDRFVKVVYDILHKPTTEPNQSLSKHILHVINTVFSQLTLQMEFAPLIEASTVNINGKQLSGLRSAMTRLTQHGTALRNVDDNPQVRLHGDCFLENILISPPSNDSGWPRQLLLVDPVSVAECTNSP